MGFSWLDIPMMTSNTFGVPNCQRETFSASAKSHREALRIAYLSGLPGPIVTRTQ